MLQFLAQPFDFLPLPFFSPSFSRSFLLKKATRSPFLRAGHPPSYKRENERLTRCRDAVRRDGTRVTRRCAMENKGDASIRGPCVDRGPRTRFHKSLCELREPRFGCSFVRYDRYVSTSVNRPCSLLSLSLSLSSRPTIHRSYRPTFRSASAHTLSGYERYV